MEHASLLIENLEVSLSQGLLKPHKKILFEVSLKVLPARIYAFLGPNGAGKTTTIKSVLGLLPRFSGKIELFGREVGDPELRSRVGYAPENAYFSPYLTPREILRSLGYLSGLTRDTLLERSQSWLELLGLLEVQDQQVKTFSKGMKQRLALVQALIHDPDLLIFDEPTTGLDPLGRNYVKEMLRELKKQGKAVFLSSHHLLDVQEICDDFCILNRGKILLEGSSKDLLGEKGNLENFFVEKVREDRG
jgi:ABC-2 type transport system ATP-binding protein